MRAVFIAAFVAFVLSILGTPLAIKGFTRLRADQPIRANGPQTHLGKKGTPTMGGVVFIVATVLAYVAGHVALGSLPSEQLYSAGPTTTGMVLLGLFVFTGGLGFIDDYLKVSKRNSLGLNMRAKLIGQVLIGALFGVLALYYDSGPDKLTVGSNKVSFVRDINWLSIGRVGAVLMFIFVVVAMSNAVNLTDGLDGLATGASIMVVGAYAGVGFWEYRHWCADATGYMNPERYVRHLPPDYCYNARDPLEIALVAAAAAAACFGFLWWNASPARIFMGDTGALALGSLIAGLALATRTVLLLPIIGLLFVLITVTWVMQIGSFKLTGRRIFRMVPLQHHFELAGWSEVNIVIRFWIIAGLAAAIGIGLFYADFLRVTG